MYLSLMLGKISDSSETVKIDCVEQATGCRDRLPIAKKDSCVSHAKGTKRITKIRLFKYIEKF